MRKVALLTLVALLASAKDKGSKAHVYNIKTGEMLEGRITGKHSGHGEVFFDNDKRHLRGEWSVVQPGDYTWGNVFAMSGTNTAAGNVYAEHRSMVLRGRASIAGDGLYIRCEFVSGGMHGHGHGACQDNEGNSYDLIF